MLIWFRYSRGKKSKYSQQTIGKILLIPKSWKNDLLLNYVYKVRLEDNLQIKTNPHFVFSVAIPNFYNIFNIFGSISV